MANKSSLKSTIAVSLTNYLDAGAIVAGASGLSLWKDYLNLTEVHLGWLNFISANCLGAAVGAIIGGFMADKFGRKAIYTYNMLIYMTGVLLVMLSVNFPMLLAGFLITGISVGVGVPASWTYISESSEISNRGRNICISQMSWGIGPMIILLLGMLFAPGGYLSDFVVSLSNSILGLDIQAVDVNVLTGFTETVSKAINELQLETLSPKEVLETLRDTGAIPVEISKQITQMGNSINPNEVLNAFNNIKNTGVSENDVLSTVFTINVFSSRVVFFSLFIVAFIAWNMQRKLEESAEWKAQKEAEARGEVKKTGLIENIAVLFTNKVAVKTVAFLAGIYLTWNLVASVMGFFQPHIYETAGGVSNEQANWMNCIQWAIIVGTTFITSQLIDKMNHKILYILGLAFALAAWFIIVAIGVSGPAGLWSFAILWGIEGGISVQIFYALWGTELFPAKFRAGAQGLMFFIVRGLSAVWGLVFTYIYGENGEGFTIAAWCMIALLVTSLIIGVIGAPKTRGKSLDQITAERYGDNY